MTCNQLGLTAAESRKQIEAPHRSGAVYLLRWNVNSRVPDSLRTTPWVASRLAQAEAPVNRSPSMVRGGRAEWQGKRDAAHYGRLNKGPNVQGR